MADPRDIQFLRAMGSGDIDDDFYPPDGSAFYLVFARIHFQDLGATASVTSADVVLSIAGDPDNNTAMPFDTTLASFGGRGISNDLNFRIEKDEESHWIVDSGSAIHVAWTNPDTGKIGWGVELGIVRISDGRL